MAADSLAKGTSLCSSKDATDGSSALRKALHKGDVKTGAFVIAWFVFNISMANLAKWLYLNGEVCVEGRGCRSFDFPLFMTAFDLALGWVFSGAYLQLLMPARPSIGLARQLREVAPLGVCFALSVGMGNLSLKYIYPSFNQMIGASSPLITVVLAAVFTRTRYNLWTWLSMPAICGGLAACVTAEVNFNMFGAVSCVGAAVLRGAKSIIQARLMAGSAKLDPVQLLFYMSPYAAAVLCIFSLAIEGCAPLLLLCWWPVLGQETRGVQWVYTLLLFTAFNAWILSVLNLLVTKYTSAVTLQVLGNVKVCLSIIVSVAIFRNPLMPSQCLGVALCLLGVWLYNRKGRASEMDAEEKTKSA